MRAPLACSLDRYCSSSLSKASNSMARRRKNYRWQATGRTFRPKPVVELRTPVEILRAAGYEVEDASVDTASEAYVAALGSELLSLKQREALAVARLKEIAGLIATLDQQIATALRQAWKHSNGAFRQLLNMAPTSTYKHWSEERSRLHEERTRLAEEALALLADTARNMSCPLFHCPTVFSEQIKSVEQKLESIQSALTSTRLRQEKAVRLQKRDERAARAGQRLAEKQAKAERQRAIAARAEANSRKLAKTVRRALASPNQCPYCGESLGDLPHADHIYPISKGGLSVETNMVLVCADCNQKKSDLTLAAFVAAFSLNRDEIEARLRGLGKDF
jgi:5-methylcytosine-specific restriction endonuclease McrA